MDRITTRSRGTLTAMQLLALLVMVAGILMVGMGQFLYVTPAETQDRVILTTAGVVIAVLALASVPVLRKRQRWELSIDQSGVTVTDHRGAHSWNWDQLDRMAYVRVPNSPDAPLLAIEPASGADLATVNGSRGWRLHNPAMLGQVDGLSASATIVPLGYLDTDDMKILDAIRHFSGDRFPEVPGSS